MKILITRHDKIGDFVTMLPVCQVLKKERNDFIVMLVSKINVPLANSLPFIDEVIEYTTDQELLLNEIQKYHFDTSISGYIDIKLAKVLWKAGIPRRIAPSTKIAQVFFNHRIKQRRSYVRMREFEYNLELLKALDTTINTNFKQPLVNFNKKRKRCVIFHLGSGGSSEGNLKLSDYLKLAKSISSFVSVGFTLGPNDKHLLSYIVANKHPNMKIYDAFESVLELTEFLSTSMLFVSTSTGPMHLAALTNTPTLTFFGTTRFSSPERWSSVNDKNLQYNFILSSHYTQKEYQKIENKLMELVHD